MSDPNPGPGRRGDPRFAYEPADERSASVFGEPTRPRSSDPQYPDPRSPDPRYPDRRYAEAPGRPPPRYPDPPAYPPTRQYERGPEWPAPYPPAGPSRRDATPGYGQPYVPDDRRPGGPPGHPGGHDRRRGSAPRGPDRRDEAGRSPREGGSGLPLGFGALVGVAGLACLLAALLALPWFEAGGREVTLSDLREAFTLAETDPDDLVPGDTGGTLPDLSEGVPSPEQVSDAVEQQARDAAAETAASVIDSGRSRYLELYTDVLWMVVAGAAALAVVLSTILSPRSFALSLLIGLRGLSAAATVAAGIAHGVALWVVFSGEGAPDPAFGVWLGLGGLAAVLLACIVGPKK
ncbi:MAG TPA: hypothetical protein VFI47_00830 [Acidimicrobiales bacterium]|nr:hypothetical protein [Acidimicrobiales bacterium]